MWGWHKWRSGVCSIFVFWHIYMAQLLLYTVHIYLGLWFYSITCVTQRCRVVKPALQFLFLEA
jgi:hypothetical protein